DRQGPSMMTRSPEPRSATSSSRYGPIWPPGSDLIRTAADALEATSAASAAPRSAAIRMMSPLSRACPRYPDRAGQRTRCDLEHQIVMRLWSDWAGSRYGKRTGSRELPAVFTGRGIDFRGKYANRGKRGADRERQRERTCSGLFGLDVGRLHQVAP